MALEGCSGLFVPAILADGHIRRTLVEQLFQSGHVTGMLVRQDVAIDVQGHVDTGVPQPDLDHLGRDAAGQLQAREGVAQVMAAHPAESRVPAQAGDQSGQGVRMEALSAEVGEDRTCSRRRLWEGGVPPQRPAIAE